MQHAVTTKNIFTILLHSQSILQENSNSNQILPQKNEKKEQKNNNKNRKKQHKKC